MNENKIQPNRMNICWQLMYLQNKDMLKLYIFSYYDFKFLWVDSFYRIGYCNNVVLVIWLGTKTLAGKDHVLA